jgi:hypothetical protein
MPASAFTWKPCWKHKIPNSPGNRRICFLILDCVRHMFMLLPLNLQLGVAVQQIPVRRIEQVVMTNSLQTMGCMYRKKKRILRSEGTSWRCHPGTSPRARASPASCKSQTRLCSEKIKKLRRGGNWKEGSGGILVRTRSRRRCWRTGAWQGASVDGAVAMGELRRRGGGCRRRACRPVSGRIGRAKAYSPLVFFFYTFFLKLKLPLIT